MVWSMTSSLRIAEVADRVGISTATVRYYERIGVLPPPDRADNGYRLYNERTVERLGFITRAKQLGCSLEEVSELQTAWEGGECGPIQDRLRRLVADKLAAAQTEIVELITLSAELRQASAALERHRPVGRCDDQCGCVTESDVPYTTAGVALTSKPTNEEVPIICTLSPDRVRHRIDEWNALLGVGLGDGVIRSAIPGGVRVEFASGVDVAELVRLTTAEQECCRFFSFRITIDDRGLALEATAPDDALDLVLAAFGAPS